MLAEQQWKPPPRVDLVLPDDEVHVWRATLDLPAWSLQRLQRTLTADELSRAGRFLVPGSRDRFIAARGLLRAILGRYLSVEPNQLRFCYNRAGKPSLVPMPGQAVLTFNLSHSCGLALYAIARDREIGVDLERIRMVSDWERMARYHLSSDEQATLCSIPAHLRCAAFYTYWACKEAHLKAIGTGFSQLLCQVENNVLPAESVAVSARADGSADWSLHTLAPGPGYVGALVVEGRGWRLRCWQWPAQIDGY
jgi:4'-phosphopantetheinyl transferase